MSTSFNDIYNQLLKNSKWNGECLETTYKCKSVRKCPQMTYKGKCISVNRVSWEYHKGKIPPGIFVCHHCDNPKCFRIEHLFLGTPSDNMKDMVKKGRDNIFGARKYSKEELIKAKELREQGYSCFQISKRLNIHPNALSAYFHRHKIIKGNPKPKDRRYCPQEYTHKILKLMEKGHSTKEICSILKISDSTRWRIMKEISLQNIRRKLQEAIN